MQCKLTHVVPGDNIDNDCDGQIDEETKDGKDNDGDGDIDEDLELVRFLSVLSFFGQLVYSYHAGMGNRIFPFFRFFLIFPLFSSFLTIFLK